MKLLQDNELRPIAKAALEGSKEFKYNEDILLNRRDLFIMDNQISNMTGGIYWRFICYAICLGYYSNFDYTELINYAKNEDKAFIRMDVLLLGQNPPKQMQYNLTAKSYATQLFSFPNSEIIRFTKINIRYGN